MIAPRFGFAYKFGPGGVAAAVERPVREGGVPRFVFIVPAGKVLAVDAFDNGRELTGASPRPSQPRSPVGDMLESDARA